jgi:hypothetical protein
MFSSDRTCCVCRIPGKSVQIHHIDGNRDNSTLSNLAVLCLDCHNATQMQGGFSRKLDPDQVILYRDDWHSIVSQRRSAQYSDETKRAAKDSKQLARLASEAEIFRENEEYELLASHYHLIGNTELRDKYIELAIKKDPSDSTIFFLRSLQGRPDLIPAEVVERRLKLLTKNQDWNQRARAYNDLGRSVDAVKDYVRGVGESLNKGNLFSAAFYLKELVDNGLIQKLYADCYEQARASDNLQLMIRSLEELGWKDELRALLLKKADEIEKSKDTVFLSYLARARGDEEKAFELSIEILRGTRLLEPKKSGREKKGRKSTVR